MSTSVRRQRAVLSVLAAAVFACFFTPNLHAAIVVVGTCKNLVQFCDHSGGHQRYSRQLDDRHLSRHLHGATLDQ